MGFMGDIVMASLGAPVQVSPLIKFGRYSALLLGIWWGSSRFQANKATEDAYKVVEAEKKILRDARNAEEKSRMTKEDLFTWLTRLESKFLRTSKSSNAVNTVDS